MSQEDHQTHKNKIQRRKIVKKSDLSKCSISLQDGYWILMKILRRKKETKIMKETDQVNYLDV